MSLFSVVILAVFLGFFLVVMPMALYLFVKLFPDKYPGFIGFPRDPAGNRSTATIVRPDDAATGE